MLMRLPTAMVVLLARGVYVSHPPSGQVVPSCYAWCGDQSRLVVGLFIFLYCRASCFVMILERVVRIQKTEIRVEQQ
jgi:hypothetical protein